MKEYLDLVARLKRLKGLWAEIARQGGLSRNIVHRMATDVDYDPRISTVVRVRAALDAMLGS